MQGNMNVKFLYLFKLLFATCCSLCVAVIKETIRIKQWEVKLALRVCHDCFNNGIFYKLL
jgi:hypothetical protein